MGKSVLYAGPIVLAVAAGQCSKHVTVHTYWGTTTERPPTGSSYAWWTAGDPDRPAAPKPAEGIEQLIRDSVEFELAALDFQKCEAPGKPDFFVATHVGRGFEPSPRGPEDRATLAVELYAAAGGLIYRGSADAAVNPTLPPEDRKARIQDAVHEILKPLAPPD